MYYSGSGCQPPQHPTMTKGAQDAVVSRAKVSIFLFSFFFFSSYSVNDFILLEWYYNNMEDSGQNRDTDMTMDGHQHHFPDLSCLITSTAGEG